MPGDDRGSRAALTIGIVAIVVGAVLIVIAGRPRTPRPRVLDETIAAATTTTAAAPATSTTSIARRATVTTQGPTTTSTSTTLASSTTTIGRARATTTTASAPTSTSSTTTSTPCSGGAPVAEIRSWDKAVDADGVWHVIVTGVVSNHTGATVQVDRVAIAFARSDSAPYQVPPDERPTPAPQVIADGGQATWRFDGVLPPGGEPTNVFAAVASWRSYGDC